MSQHSCIRISYRIQSIKTCNCESYSYPHSWGVGDCKTSIVDNPPEFSPPKRGLASKLHNFLNDIQTIIEEETDENYDQIAQLLSDFRNNIYVSRNTHDLDLKHN